MLGVEIVQQNQVEIGGCRHLAAAQPAHRDNRGLLSLDPAVLFGEPTHCQPMHGIDDTLGDVGERGRGLLRGHRTGQDSCADQEQALLPEQPQPVEEFLVRIRIRKRRRQSLRQFALVRHRAEKAWVDQPVHDLRLPRQHVAEPGRGTQHQRHQRDQFAVLAEQRNQPAAALQGLQEAIERGDRAVGLLGIREAVDQRRHELDKGASASARFRNTRYSPAIHCCTVFATMTGFLKPSVARCSISSLGSSGRRCNPPPAVSRCRSDRPRTACS